ncbi:hyaluronidase-2 [Erpetoichthys calabaricus]|uniref:Hyaluronidase n=1 Tax=Erpetoichthys calabaricus TaxID=27687 RepID=A0A8C4TEV9_ERPCA|nr:hyaluronidase-2 [Erpetoichthys calabaricus]XP_028679952.1 hyaluronidase-2 [Erpetoichthys calabaricus]XP_028679953.1 hyaluronidase-2 [Erpetoichthys calabaricus]XP_028679955.1 hyaluronidase-2 [Erpetoichthys calabaricus]XP_051777135.1 hyaluronidase-2 [Erpetoichthys calabaricus]
MICDAWCHLAAVIYLISTGLCAGARGDVLKATSLPLFPQKPFALIWNAPTEECRPRHKVDLNFDQFQVRATPNEGFVAQNLTIFYKDRLGLYPYITEKSENINGGLPQLASLQEHLAKMPEGVNKYIRDTKKKGLAVIDWEEWRPLWIRNWEAKDIYRYKSRLEVARQNPSWTKEQVNKAAQMEFEVSAKHFILETLKVAKNLRPEQLWGFYLFPDCYNHDYKNSLENYTGRCPDVEISRNDQLAWLWQESTALFPSIYMDPKLQSTEFGQQFVRNRVKEAMRVASIGDGLARPVFVYTRPTYINGMMLLSEMDLVSTIGESAALGAAGVIFWGEAMYSSSPENCRTLKNYLEDLLGRYLFNVSKAAELCSSARCSSNGRCVRLNTNQNVYLHLNPSSFKISRVTNNFVLTGSMSTTDTKAFSRDFVCQCYSGYKGGSCETDEAVGSRGTTPFLIPIVVHVFTMLALTLFYQ